MQYWTDLYVCNELWVEIILQGSFLFLKFGISEKLTNLDKSADLFSKRQNNEEDFFQIMCASQKVWTLRICVFT